MFSLKPERSCARHSISTAMMSAKQILLIDSEPDTREIVQTCLELTTDWQVAAVSCCHDGIQIAESQPVQAILVNIERLDWKAQLGLAALRRRATTSTVPILALAERVRASELQAARAIGLAGCISKPFDGVSLGQQIVCCLGWQG